jgi:hypothetical protein
MIPDDLPDLRRALLTALYLRRAGALTASFVVKKANQRAGLDASTREAELELAYLTKRKLVEEAEDADGLGGNLTRYALTADGVNYCEKHELTD